MLTRRCLGGLSIPWSASAKDGNVDVLIGHPLAYAD